MSFQVSPFSGTNRGFMHRSRLKAPRSLDSGSSTVLSSDSVAVSRTSPLADRKLNGSVNEEGNGRLRVLREEDKRRNAVLTELPPLWDDGYGTQTVEDYFIAVKELNKSDDGGPPRWFCPVECSPTLKDSPTLLFLPGLDGTGMGLILHHKALGKAFEVRCLHIPVHDRTSFEGLVKIVEEAVKLEHALFPNKPIYLVGDSFGACLALAVASRNPTVDLVLILANPATSFGRSQLQPLFPILEAWPNELHAAVPFLLSFVMGDPTKMAAVSIENRLPPMKKIEQLSNNLTALLPCLPDLADIIPKDTLLWKLKLLKSAAAHANSRLHAVKAEVLVLASGNDKMLPSEDEAKRLKSSLQHCKVRNFKDSGHTLLLEDGIGLLTIIRGTCMYRRSRRRDMVMNFIPPSATEFNYAMDQVVGSFRIATGSVMFSTLEDGKIVKGLAGVPDEGPVLLVGYHMLMGLELIPLVEEVLRQKGIMLRGMAHPLLFVENKENSSAEFSTSDWVKIFGGVPVSATYLYKLLSEKSHVLLYPGGAREALHFKGEEYKLIWPQNQEFVRMAARFGATIVPFGVVGEDDIAELVLDYNDLIKVPIINDYIRDSNRDAIKIRDETSGEVANQNLFIPGLLPKIPGRFYYLFGKPVRTKGMEKMLEDKHNANQLYLQIKSQVQHNINYLIKKREEDPYRNIVDRIMYRAIYSSDTPAFKP
ncbi:acyltransferase-like protein At1g54570, chloroplastic isoform X1 [Neltuma alba]|uniref:acyltransferase-like protein At1g54570, chloroplastic isoform X1 n=1 Tax=Neltuma alba TaxID=207710 RepID=UPI0010A41860|nr:acyltransferase-like protein At1g54570, chloroplastic isoform X1 [Prosopis alba]